MTWTLLIRVQELEFLADSSLLTQEQLSSILAQLPSARTLQPASVTHQAPTEAFSQLNVSNAQRQNGYFAPSRSEKQQPRSVTPSDAPPAYPVAPTPPIQQKTDALTYASALYAYKPTDPHDLELSAGDRIAVTEYMNAEWWKGRSERTGAEGIFPRNYVRIDDKIPTAATAKAPAASKFGNLAGNAGSSSTPSDPNAPPSKTQEYGKKAGKKMGNAVIFGAGATVGSKIINGIF